jgi:hypothetical protein
LLGIDPSSANISASGSDDRVRTGMAPFRPRGARIEDWCL